MEGHGFIRSARTVGACTLLSRALGLTRDVICASAFGSGRTWDAFIFAFRIPNLFRRLFGEGSLSLAFIPVMADYAENRSAKETRDLVSVVFTAVAGGLTVIVALGMVGATVFYKYVKVSADGTLFLRLLWITLPYAIFICLAAVSMAVLNTRGHFLVPGLAPAVGNIFWIGGVIALAPWIGIYGVAAAVTVGGLAQLVMQFPVLRRKGVSPRPMLSLKHPGLVRTVKDMLPLLVGSSAMQINVMLDSLIAWLLAGKGGVSNLYYGDRVVEFSLGVFGLAVTTAAFPMLARRAAVGDFKGMAAGVEQALRVLAFIALPAALGTILVREPLVDVLFRRHAFDWEAVHRTSRVVLFYSLGLWSYCSVHVLTRAHYALNDMTTPVKIGIAMILCNAALNLALVFPLREAGLALATAVTATGNFYLLFRSLRRKVPALRSREVMAAVLRSAAGCAVLAAAALLSLELIAAKEAFLIRAARLLLPVVTGSLVYGLMALAIRSRELKEVLARRG